MRGSAVKTQFGGDSANTEPGRRDGSSGGLWHTAVRLPLQIQGRGQANMTCPDDVVETISSIPELLDSEFGRTPNAKPRLLLDEEVADILRMTIDWVREHAEEIPGFLRLGSYYRFRSLPLERWLGTLDPLLLVDEAAAMLEVPKSWVYQNVEQIPGYLRLGRYVRFRRRILEHFIAGSGVAQ
jgi:hypothetical protein